jgi:hypothetical protein
MHQSNPVYVFTFPLIVQDKYRWQHANIQVSRYFNLKPQLPMECETCIVSVSFRYTKLTKNDDSMLKKADQHTIISQVKNWINPWVNLQ